MMTEAIFLFLAKAAQYPPISIIGIQPCSCSVGLIEFVVEHITGPARGQRDYWHGTTEEGAIHDFAQFMVARAEGRM